MSVYCRPGFLQGQLIQRHVDVIVRQFDRLSLGTALRGRVFGSHDQRGRVVQKRAVARGDIVGPRKQEINAARAAWSHGVERSRCELWARAGSAAPPRRDAQQRPAASEMAREHLIGCLPVL